RPRPKPATAPALSPCGACPPPSSRRMGGSRSIIESGAIWFEPGAAMHISARAPWAACALVFVFTISLDPSRSQASEQGKEITPRTDWHLTVRTADLSRDGKRVVLGYAGGQALGVSLTVWDVATGKLLSVITPHAGDVSFCAFLPDGEHLVSTGMD